MSSTSSPAYYTSQAASLPASPSRLSFDSGISDQRQSPRNSSGSPARNFLGRRVSHVSMSPPSSHHNRRRSLQDLFSEAALFSSATEQVDPELASIYNQIQQEGAQSPPFSSVGASGRRSSLSLEGSRPNSTTPLIRAASRSSFGDICVIDCTIAEERDVAKQQKQAFDQLDKIFKRVQKVQNFNDLKKLSDKYISVSKNLDPLDQGSRIEALHNQIVFEILPNLTNKLPHRVKARGQRYGHGKLRTRLEVQFASFRHRFYSGAKPGADFVTFLNDMIESAHSLQFSEVRFFSKTTTLNELLDSYQVSPDSFIQFFKKERIEASLDTSKSTLEDLILRKNYLSIHNDIKDFDPKNARNRPVVEGDYTFFHSRINNMNQMLVAEVIKDVDDEELKVGVTFVTDEDMKIEQFVSFC